MLNLDHAYALYPSPRMVATAEEIIPVLPPRSVKFLLHKIVLGYNRYSLFIGPCTVRRGTSLRHSKPWHPTRETQADIERNLEQRSRKR